MPTRESLLHLMRELKFYGMQRMFEEPWDDNSWQASLPTLERLLHAETKHRQARSLNYRLELARLPCIKQLDTFDWTVSPLEKHTFERLQTGAFIQTHDNIILVGGNGTGKSHLALALAYQAITHGYRLRFWDFYQLACRLLLAKRHDQETHFIAWLKRFAVLVIDQMGYLPIDPQAAPLLCELFLGCYEKTSLVITTHLAFDEWVSVFGSAKLASAIIDRLTHHCHILETGNTSWRLKQGQQHDTK